MALMKHQKRRLIACEIANCFHPAHSAILQDGVAVWYCNCHNPASPGLCRETIETMERHNHLTSGDCAICRRSNSRNPTLGLEGAIVFICDSCYNTPMGELRKYYRR